MKFIATLSVITILLPFTLFACPNLNGVFNCKDLETGEVQKETYSTNLLSKIKTMKISTEGDNEIENYKLDAGRKVLIPAMYETVDYNDGQLKYSSTHYTASCLSSKSLKIVLNGINQAFDKNGTLLARENSELIAEFDMVTSKEFTKSIESKIFGQTYVSTLLCTKVD